MDEIARFNRERWNALARAGVEFARPFLNLDTSRARQVVDKHGLLGDVTGKDVLCLAASGGQQSPALALLGAQVTVFDLADEQLRRDRETAAHYGIAVETVQGDMRDLSCFADNAFDVVWQAHSINFAPDPVPVFREVARVLRPGGLYRLSIHNPFTHRVDDEAWDPEHGYPLKLPYRDGEIDVEAAFTTTKWIFEAPDGSLQEVEGPREFCHTLSTVVNGLAQHEFHILGLWETTSDEPDPEPGTWEHFKSIAAPYLTLWSRWQGGVKSKE